MTLNEKEFEGLLQEIRPFTRVNKKTGRIYQSYRKHVVFELPGGLTESKEFFGKTPEEVVKHILEFQENLNKGLSVEYKSKILRDCIEEWLWNTVKNEVRNSTFDNYFTAFQKHFKKMRITNLTINELKTSILQEEFNSLSKKGYTYSQIYNIRKLLSKFYNYALVQDWALKNPCVGTVVPKPVEVRKRKNSLDDMSAIPFSQEEMDKIFESCDGKNTSNYMYIFLRIAFATGMRVGEILGLSFGNIDLENRYIYVRDALKYQKFYNDDKTWHSEFVLGEPKTKSSVRDIYIVDNLKNDLIKYMQQEEARYKAAGITLDADCLLFTTKNFKFIDDRAVRRAWHRILKRAGIRQTEKDKNKRRRLHNTRHTFATNFFVNSNNIHAVSSALGHKSVQTTQNTYTHLTPRHLAEDMDKMNWMFDKVEP